MVPEGDADLRADGDVLSGERHFVIFNPASGRGRGQARIAAYKELLEEQLDDVTYGATTRGGEEADLAERALAEGFDVIVAVGGDGTWSNVADRIASSDREDVRFGILPSGTGNDFGRNFGFDPRNPRDAVRVLAEGHAKPVDMGYMETMSASEHSPNQMESRHFLNLVGFGFDVAVIDAAKKARFLRGELLYKLTALQQLFRFPGAKIAVRPEGSEERDRQLLMLTVSNARFFGGGFPIAPDAAIDDGKLHACLIGDASPPRRLRLFNLAERGHHVRDPNVEVVDDSGFELAFHEPPRFEMDGDVRRAADSTIRVRSVPGALQVIGPRT